jgi:hypothetical protein
MTKDQALALKDGDVIYLIDDARSAVFQASVQDSPILEHGLRKLVIGEPGYASKEIRVKRETGYLTNAAYIQTFAPELFFTNPIEAFSAFKAYVQTLSESLRASLSTLHDRLDEAYKMTDEDETHRLHAITHG